MNKSINGNNSSNSSGGDGDSSNAGAAIQGGGDQVENKMSVDARDTIVESGNDDIGGGDDRNPNSKCTNEAIGMDKNGAIEQKDETLLAIVNNELNRLGLGGSWVWKLFILCVAPNILNGFHVASYVFIGQMPVDYWCIVPEMIRSNWTVEQIRNITAINNSSNNIASSSSSSNGCRIRNYDYTLLSRLSYDEAVEYLSNQPQPFDTISCQQISHSTYAYREINDGASIVPEWNLVCENSYWRTTVQVAVSFGKFIGAFTFGIVSDKFGRRPTFTVGAAFYLLGSFLTSFSHWYWLFVIGRFALGLAASGLFYPAFTLLTENISVKNRSWMSVAFSMSYPIGMLYLALFANFLPEWRNLQLSLTIPALLLIVNCFLLKESPRWLISKGREQDAYKLLFKEKKDLMFMSTNSITNPEKSNEKTENSNTLCKKFKTAFIELSSLYGPSKYRRMALICHFTWCVTSLSYYVTALNADNLSANRVVYVASTGCVDIIGISLSILLLRIMGRKPSIFLLFALAGTCLLILLGIPRDYTNWIVVFAMIGRLGITAVYAIVTLHTAEIFPTEIRNSALGICSTCAHIGSIAAPYIVDFLGIIAWYIPTTICGVSIIVAGLLTLTHPETRTSNLQDKVKQDA